MTNEERDREWQKVVEAESGVVLHKEYDSVHDVHGYVLRGPGALCGYVGTIAEHPLWKRKKEYPGTYENFDWLDVHGGPTYGGRLDFCLKHKRYYFIGWDYAHGGDAVSFKEGSLAAYSTLLKGTYRWTIPEVVAHVRRAMRTFANYKCLVEKVEAGLCDENAIKLFLILENKEY